MNIKIENIAANKIEVVKSLGEDLKAKRQEVLLYRIVFLTLGCVMVYMGAHLLFKSGPLVLPLVTEWAAPFKGMATFFSFLFGMAALWVGCALRSEREVLHDRYKRKKRQLKALDDVKGLDHLDQIAIKGERSLDHTIGSKHRFAVLQSTVALLESL